MSVADKMFEKLGYCVDEGRINIYVYVTDDDGGSTINFYVFHKESKSISIYKTLLSKEELQAINKKVEELGWN